MEIKDWLLLIVPVMLNGVLIWVLQFIIIKQNERRTTFRMLREEIFKKYIDKVDKAISSCRALYTVKADAVVGDTESMKNLEYALEDLRLNIRELYYYYDTYKIVLSKNSNIAYEYSNLKARFEEWVLNWNNPKIQLSFIHDCEDILHNIMNEGLRYIYGIK